MTYGPCHQKPSAVKLDMNCLMNTALFQMGFKIEAAISEHWENPIYNQCSNIHIYICQAMPRHIRGSLWCEPDHEPGNALTYQSLFMVQTRQHPDISVSLWCKTGNTLIYQSLYGARQATPWYISLLVVRARQRSDISGSLYGASQTASQAMPWYIRVS